MMEEVCNRFLGVSVPVTPSYDMGADTLEKPPLYLCSACSKLFRAEEKSQGWVSSGRKDMGFILSQCSSLLTVCIFLLFREVIGSTGRLQVCSYHLGWLGIKLCLQKRAACNWHGLLFIYCNL